MIADVNFDTRKTSGSTLMIVAVNGVVLALMTSDEKHRRVIEHQPLRELPVSNEVRQTMSAAERLAVLQLMPQDFRIGRSTTSADFQYAAIPFQWVVLEKSLRGPRARVAQSRRCYGLARVRMMSVPASYFLNGAMLGLSAGEEVVKAQSLHGCSPPPKQVITLGPCPYSQVPPLELRHLQSYVPLTPLPFLN